MDAASRSIAALVPAWPAPLDQNRVRDRRVHRRGARDGRPAARPARRRRHRALPSAPSTTPRAASARPLERGAIGESVNGRQPPHRAMVGERLADGERVDGVPGEQRAQGLAESVTGVDESRGVQVPRGEQLAQRRACEIGVARDLRGSVGDRSWVSSWADQGHGRRFRRRVRAVLRRQSVRGESTPVNPHQSRQEPAAASHCQPPYALVRNALARICAGRAERPGI